MNEQMREIFDYLERRKDYCIWAGLCVYAHLGIKHSLDVDIYTDEKSTKKDISEEFQKRGWKSKPHPKLGYGWDWDKLERNKTTFDIVYTEPSSRLLVPDAIDIEIYDVTLRFLSSEGLYLTKLGQLSWLNREGGKKRDVKAINELRKSVDTKKLNNLASQLPPSYWLAGQI